MNQTKSQKQPGQVQQKQSTGAHWTVKFMFGYLYYMQGFILSLSATIVYIYPTLPDYFTLSLFSLCLVPFSFKFVTAPFLEKYSSIAYGKRKTWVIGSQFLTSFMIFVCSFFTRLEEAKIFAILAILIYLGLSFQDIAMDGLCLKELDNPSQMSMIQGASQSFGNITGSLLVLKLTSEQFSSSIGLSSPITNMQTIMIVLSILMMVPTIIIHFKFVETYSEAEEKTMQSSLCEVYSIYKYFFMKDYRYCRVLIFNLIYYQGSNFFYAGYPYELIKAGFSKNTMNTIDNVQVIIISILMFFFGAKANAMGFVKSYTFVLSVIVLTSLYLWFFFPLDIVPIFITNFILQIFFQWNFLLSTNICAYFPDTGATGMIYTMSASTSNLGKQTFPHTAILKIYPWRVMGMIGIGIQVLTMIFFIPKMIQLVHNGQTNIQKQEQNNYNELNEQNKD